MKQNPFKILTFALAFIILLLVILMQYEQIDNFPNQERVDIFQKMAHFSDYCGMELKCTVKIDYNALTVATNCDINSFETCLGAYMVGDKLNPPEIF